MAAPKEPLSAGKRTRYILYALATTIAFFLILDAGIVWLERAGHLDTTTANDDVWMVLSDPWVDDGAGHMVTDEQASQAMARERFVAEKGVGFRVFLLGGSFLRGVPYTHAGTIEFWLQRELQARLGDRRVEVVNAAAVAQGSLRVAEITEFATGHAPDALVIATCNNEGTLPPSQLTARLHRLGTFRLFRNVLRGEESSSGPVHTPQDPDVDQVREAYRSNLRRMIAAAQQQEIPVYLCTLPINLRYEGEEAGLPLQGQEWEEQGMWRYPACVQRGIEAMRRRDYEKAEAQLRDCEEVEALRWIGLIQFARGELEPAQRTLEHYTELLPRNRCRPSFNEVVRAVAAESTGVHLVDLDRMAREASAGGIPGPEMFVDYCHMRWEAQGLVADAILSELESTGLVPSRPADAPEQEPRSEVFQRLQGAEPPVH